MYIYKIQRGYKQKTKLRTKKVHKVKYIDKNKIDNNEKKDYTNVFIFDYENFKYIFFYCIRVQKQFTLIQNEKLQIEQKCSESTEIIKEY